MPPGFSAAFAAADLRARAVVYYQQCAATVVRLRATGTFGPAGAAPRLVYCERTSDGIPIGGVFDIDSGYSKPRRLSIVRLDGARARYTDAIDTARIAREARLVRDVTRDVTPAMRKLARQFAVAPVSLADGTSEGWVLSFPAVNARSAILGGDIALTRNADGTLRRLVDRSATRRVMPLASSGIVQLTSAERDAPAVADLVVARSLAERGRDVIVSTMVARSTLSRGLDPASGSRFVWEHTRITPP
jgi:hypothetical protein